MGFPGGSTGKESAFNVGELDLIPGLGRSPGEGKGYPLQYSGLENSMDCIVHGVAKSQTRLRDSHFHLLVEIRESPLVAIKTQHRKKKKEKTDVLERELHRVLLGQAMLIIRNLKMQFFSTSFFR